MFSTNQIQSRAALVAAIQRKVTQWKLQYDKADVFAGRYADGTPVQFAKTDTKARNFLVVTPRNGNFLLTQIGEDLQRIEAEFGIDEILVKETEAFVPGDHMNRQQIADSAKAYFNTGKRVFLLIAEAKQGYGRVEIGKPIEIPEAELEASVEVIIKLLDGFKSNVYSAEKAVRYSKEEYRIFRRKHLSINIGRYASGELVIKPLHREDSGYVGREGEGIVIPKDDVRKRLASALRQAVKIAS